MSDINWEALAEIHIKYDNNINDKEYNFCLCSRVLIKNQTEVVAIEQEELSEAYDVFNEQDCENHVSTMNRTPKEFVQDEDDSDANSCYFSASASHTDNYCTTDEHERDSGADISEYHGAVGSAPREIYKKQHRDELKCMNMERNNSLPDIFCAKELSDQWEKYWSTNGERLIWSSWIDKYSDFISPSYKNMTAESNEDDESLLSSDDRQIVIATGDCRDNIDTEIIVSSCSPGANCSNVNEPIDETTNSDAPLRDLMDSLLIPRCDSVSSSIPLTIGTTDSMTNVTHMTLSSYGFCSSRVSSENSQLSESTPSSLSPPFNFDECDETKIELLNDDGTDQHWQLLWQHHFQEQYSKHYNDFMEDKRPNKTSLSTSLQQDSEHFYGEPSTQIEQDCNTFNNEEFKHLTDLGLPTAFGKFGKGHLQRNAQRQIDEISSDRVKAAFLLMGYAFNNNDTDNSKTNGHVIYRKRNIRLHNNMLKLKKKKNDYDCQTVKDDAVLSLIADTSSDEADTPIGGMALGIKFESIDSGTVSIQNTTPTAEIEKIDKTYKFESIEKDGAHTSSLTTATVLVEHQSEDTKMSICAPSEETTTTKNTNKKSKKKRRQNKMLSRLPNEIANDKTLYKYWCKRFSLFSLFDLGIKLDRESWFSVTPEKVAAYTAARCECDIIIDAFCGAGGNTIQFAKTCHKVIAIDIDPKKIEMAKHNASIYGVCDKIEFIVGDFFQLAPTLKADCVFLSPPWGGPQYLKEDLFDIEKSLLPLPAAQLMEIARKISLNIAIYLPRNTNTHQLAKLAGAGNSVEIEQGFLDRKLIAITAFYGNLLKNVSN